VVVEDNGQGCDPQATRPGALGLVGMHERVALVGGRLTVESTPGMGATIAAQVPLPRSAEGE
jgi:signal transduction histidine kinase